MYSKEEIEKKRLLALALKQQKNSNLENAPVRAPVSTSTSKSVFQTPTNKSNFQTSTNKSIFQTSTSTNSPWQKNNSGVLRQKSAQNRFDPMNSNKFYGNKTESVTGNCIVIQNDRFAVELAKYHLPLIEVFKTIPSKAYGTFLFTPCN